MAGLKMKTLCKVAMLAVLCDDELEEQSFWQSKPSQYKVIMGKVGSMAPNKVIAAIETAAKREALLDHRYRTEHAIYHAALEAIQGVCQGQIILGEVHRTVGLRFAIAIGPRHMDDTDPLWLAVALYGTICAPIKGFEHEALGLGINHL